MGDDGSRAAGGERGGGAGVSSRRPARATLATTLVVLASLLLPFAAVTLWLHHLVLDTDRYVSTVQPLAEDTAVQHAVATRLGVAVVDALDVERRARSVLPERAKFLAAPIAAGAERLVRSAALAVLDSSEFADVWEAANRRAHDQLVAALTGRGSGRSQQDDGKVVLELGPMAARVAGELDRAGFTLPRGVDVSRTSVRYVLIDAAQVRSLRASVRVLDELAWLLPIGTIVLSGLAVLLAPRRRVMLLRAGVGATVAMLVAVVAYGLARTAYLDALPGAGPHAAGAAVFDTVTRYVERGFKAVLVLGLVVWLLAWLVGPSRPAAAARRQWHRLLGRASEGLGDGAALGPVNAWVAAHEGVLRGAVLVALGVLLVGWERPTGKVVLLLALVGLVVVALIQLAAAGARRTDADADP